MNQAGMRDTKSAQGQKVNATTSSILTNNTLTNSSMQKEPKNVDLTEKNQKLDKNQKSDLIQQAPTKQPFNTLVSGGKGL